MITEKTQTLILHLAFLVFTLSIIGLICFIGYTCYKDHMCELSIEKQLKDLHEYKSPLEVIFDKYPNITNEEAAYLKRVMNTPSRGNASISFCSGNGCSLNERHNLSTEQLIDNQKKGIYPMGGYFKSGVKDENSN